MNTATRKRAFAVCVVVIAATVAILASLPQDRAERPERTTPRRAPAKLVVGGAPASAGQPAARPPGVRTGPTATARRFAAAYLRYQAGVADDATWRALSASGAPALVDSLRSTQIAAPQGQPRVGRVAGARVADRAATTATVLVRTRDAGGPDGQQSIELTLARKGTAWRVTGMG
jgi:hypothetical protein